MISKADKRYIRNLNKKEKVIDRNSSINQEIKGKLVHREVMACVSGLFEEMIQKEIVQIEDIENYWIEDVELEPQEIFEWWLVSEWLYKQLKEKGEPVYNYNDFNFFWGRTCTGQTILLDSVISDIAEEMEILDAQEKAEKGLKENKDLAELLAEFSVDIIQIYQKIIERYVEEMKIKIQYEEEEL